ncbi:MAG TPA: hypothetical protein VGH92_07390 [Gaiellaceae bacterium]
MSGWTRWALVVFAATVVFAIGVAVGEAIHDNPTPGITRTSLTTIHP